ncbi:MAG TPA: zf-HC2 domain-containing protein [Bryobacterales bacterium]|jgi:hypothetical protein|nr:zf-HC2 domain-containing protein [Bryobacterales bacterium]
MQCSEFEIRLCDYLDGSLPTGQRQAHEEHAAGCARCAALLEDCRAVGRFLERVDAVEAPPELVTSILHQTRSGSWALLHPGWGASRAGEEARGWRSWLHPLLQPRYAMSMAMTIISLSMLYRITGAPIRQLEASDLSPVAIWYRIDDSAHRIWNRGVKLYQNARFVYEIVEEWRTLESEEEPPAPAEAAPGPDSGSGAAPGRERPVEPRSPRKVDPRNGNPAAPESGASEPGEARGSRLLRNSGQPAGRIMGTANL